jgi:RNA polymerase sigma-70 factor, ECF subfamily
VSAPECPELPVVWATCQAELARLVAALGVPRDCVDDVLQDVYLAVLQKPPLLMDEEAMRRWLFRLAINRTNLEHRRRGRWRAKLAAWAERLRGGSRAWSAPGATDAQSSAREEQELVRRTLTELEPLDRSVLVLRYYTEMNSRQIAEILEMPDSTVRSRLQLARQRLAGALKRAGVTP